MFLPNKTSNRVPYFLWLFSMLIPEIGEWKRLHDLLEKKELMEQMVNSIEPKTWNNSNSFMEQKSKTIE